MNICQKCGAQGEPSKILGGHFPNDRERGGCFGIKVNIENMILMDCIKCKKCGHSWMSLEAIKSKTIKKERK